MTSATPVPTSATPTRPVEVVELSALWQWESMYRLLAASFPPEERDSRQAIIAALADGSMVGLGVVRDSRVVAAAAVCVYERVTLVLYLAVDPAVRGEGLGGRVLDAAVARAHRSGADAWVLAEIEHPDAHTGSPEFGDPHARLRFYARHGVRLIGVPYFMPAMGPGGLRVPALMLGALAVEDALVTRRDSTGAPVAARSDELAAMVSWYLAANEGAVGDDAATRRLLGALAAPEVALVDPRDVVQVPVGTLDASTLYAAGSGSGGGRGL